MIRRLKLMGQGRDVIAVNNDCYYNNRVKILPISGALQLAKYFPILHPHCDPVRWEGLLF